jgi:hypothetical protein
VRQGGALPDAAGRADERLWLLGPLAAPVVARSASAVATMTG